LDFGLWTRLDAALKRAMDVVGAVLGLICLSPLFGGIAIAVKLYDRGHVFYRAVRVGRGGRPFRLYKFRTMIVDADRAGPGITASGDRRITPVGRILRRTKLDELPQLLNVLVGDMSLVGPRPEDPRYVALYSREQRRVLRVRPGITSAASLAYRNEEEILSGPDWETRYRTEVMPTKLRIDLDYLDRRSVISDIGIIVRTLKAVVGIS
jgi:lipopolysaccharide/colanic/teichoic acid biosynthesis glycosyltransferase